MTTDNEHSCSVFDCWSGERSRAVAKAMRWLLNELFNDDIHVFFSEDINKGKVWFEEVQENLSRARAAILCLTPENIDSPWLHFEAGALSVGLAQRNPSENARRRVVFPYLLDVDPRSLAGGPLASFQGTHATREDTMRLMTDLAVELFAEDTSTARAKADLCSELWDEFERRFRDHNPPDINEICPGFESMFRRKTFDEPLYDCSGQHWIARYDAAREVLSELRGVEDQVRTLCSRASCDLFSELVATVDAYAMDMEATLLLQASFERDTDTGRVMIDPPGAGLSCDLRRRKVKQIVAELLDPTRAPIIDDSVQFRRSETFEEKKRLVHRLETRIKEEDAEWRSSIRDEGQRSDWDLDRIASYLVGEHDEKPPGPSDRIAAIERELERVRATKDSPSFVALHYALRMNLKALEKDATLEAEDRSMLQRVLDDLAQEARDRGSVRVEQNVERIRIIAGISADR